MGREYLLTKSRGRFFSYQVAGSETSSAVMPTWHPSVLLEKPARKKDVWEDMQKIMSGLGL
ncbi:hypothetical protein [Desulfamplus magnetovallimortis]|nr:hypothetical protein [Desulfamplus magnetovallimortis]